MCVQAIRKEYKVTRSAKAKIHPGAARLTLCLVDRKIVQRATNGSRQDFSRNLAAQQTNPFVNTVLPLLKEVGLFGRRPAKKPLITAKDCKVLLDWAHTHRNWVVQQWHKAIKSDKPKFSLSSKDEIMFV
ncbi:hypothetical protein V3C99_013599 [Haemonchus contortus]